MDAFLIVLRRELEERHPGVLWLGMVRGRFTAVLEVDGQETPVPLHPIYRHIEAFPRARTQLIDRLVGEIRAAGLDLTEDHDFADVANSIMPQIRTPDWIRARTPAFGNAALVTRSIGADLSVCYVIDDPWTMVFVCHEHLRRWGRTEDDLHHLATHNLLTSAGAEVPVPQPGEEPVLVRTGDGYDAARVLLLDPEQIDGLLVALPERDCLWVGEAPGEQLARLMELNAEQSARSAHPVSPHLYRLRSGQLEPVTGVDR